MKRREFITLLRGDAGLSADLVVENVRRSNAALTFWDANTGSATAGAFISHWFLAQSWRGTPYPPTAFRS